MRIYDFLGAHYVKNKDVNGTLFAVWAPNAEEVFVEGDFNGWDKFSLKMFPRLDSSGIWEGLVDGDLRGQNYKYVIRTKNNQILEKFDPVAFRTEIPSGSSGNASLVQDINFKWTDDDFVKKLFIWALMLRVDMENLGFDSINRYAIGDENSRYTNMIAMFQKINLARKHSEISSLQIKVAPNSKDGDNWSELFSKLRDIVGLAEVSNE